MYTDGFPPLELKAWSLYDFVRHYFSGRGRSIDLERVGLLDRFRRSSSVRMAVTEWESKQKRVAAELVADQLRIDRQAPFRQLVTASDRTLTDVTSDPILFPIGHSTFFRSARWNIDADLTTRRYAVEGLMTFEIRDRFADPADTLDLVPGEFEFLFGTPYEINARWSQAIRHHGIAR